MSMTRWEQAQLRAKLEEVAQEGIWKSRGQLEIPSGDVPDWLVDVFPGWRFNPWGLAYTEGDLMFLTDQNNPYLYTFNRRTKEITVIKDDLPATGGKLDYNPVNETVLWAVDGEVREIDKNGNVVNSLSTGQSGYAGHWSGKDRFVLVTQAVDTYGHYAFEMDWNGNELWSFGVKGTSGDDLSHLDYPCDVILRGSFGNYVIADANNNRILEDNDGDGTAEEVMVVSDPRNLQEVYPGGSFLVATGIKSDMNCYPWFILHVGAVTGDNQVKGAIPGSAWQDLAAHPLLPLVAMPAHEGFWETNFRAFYDAPMPPQELRPVFNAGIAAGDTLTTPPMLTWFYDKISVYSVGDQPHDVTIERLRTDHNLHIGATAPPVYDDLDTFSPSANSLRGWHTDVSLAVIRIRVKNTGDSSGTFNTWISLKQQGR